MDARDLRLESAAGAPLSDVAAVTGSRPPEPAIIALDDGHFEVARTDLLRIAFVALCALFAWLASIYAPRAVITAGILGTAIGGYPMFKEAGEALWERRMTMELSMSIGVIAALAIGEAFTALIITFFVLAAEILEERTVFRGRRAVRDLLDLLPQNANLRRGNQLVEVRIDELRRGDCIVVKPANSIPVDGVVAAGHSFVDESAITGEPMPAEKLLGRRVYAGTINQSGALEVRTEAVGRDTAFGRLVDIVQSAEKSPAPVQNTADRLAAYLVYIALGGAMLTLVLTMNVKTAISVIIVAGACGVAAGTPLAILGAVGHSARDGSIVKGGIYIEKLSRVDTVVLDKTGTLTLGEPKVVELRPAAGFTESEMLEAAAIAERLSEHPLARAILRKASEAGLIPVEPQSFSYFPGKGIACALNGDEILAGNEALLAERGVHIDASPARASHLARVFVARSGRLLGSASIADALRPEAKKAVAALKRMGLHIVLLTGDVHSAAEAAAKELGVDEFEAEVLPDQKSARVKALAASGRRVAMVGDGINDATALVQAYVGIALGSGTDLAKESADIILPGNDLAKLVATFETARRCMRIIMFNFAGTVLVDSAGMTLAALGFLNPLVAAVIHVSSELAFILNSARLLPRRGR